MKKFKENDKGFTLVELVIVIAIILVLAALLVPRIMGSIEDARRASEVADAKTIASEITTYNAIEITKDVPKTVPSGLSGDDFKETYVTTTDDREDDSEFIKLEEENGNFKESNLNYREIDFKRVKIRINKDGSAEVHWMESGVPIDQPDE